MDISELFARNKRNVQARRRADEQGYNQPAQENRFIDAQNQLGTDRETSGYEGLRDFDPGAAFKEYTEGATRGAKGYLGDELEKLAGRASGQGRLNTGFFDEDQGQLARNIYGDLNNTISSAALQTAGMDQSRRGNLLDYGTDRTNRYLDLLTGNYDRLTGKANAKKQGGGGFMGFLAKAAPIAASFL